MKIRVFLTVAAAIGLSACQSGGGAGEYKQGETGGPDPMVKNGKQPELARIDDGPVDPKPVNNEAGNEGPVSTELPVRLDTIEKFSTLFDKKLIRTSSDYFTYRANGRLIGFFTGHRYSGSWTMEEGYLCRKINTARTTRYATDCQVLIVTGNRLTIIREKGNGPKLIYTISQ